MTYPDSSHINEAPVLNGDKGSCARIRNASMEGLFSPLLWLYPTVAVLMAALFVSEENSGMPFSVFTQDPLAVAKGQPYFGLLSNLGVLFWCATSAICLFVWTVLKSIEPVRKSGFFLFSGLLSLLLTLDDLFQLHEAIFPDMLGIRQRYVLFGYLAVTAVYFGVYRLRIMRKFTLFIFATLLFFAVSIAEDATSLVLHITGSISCHYLVEDGSKLFGIISWFIYFACVAREELRICTDSRAL